MVGFIILFLDGKFSFCFLLLMECNYILNNCDEILILEVVRFYRYMRDIEEEIFFLD